MCKVLRCPNPSAHAINLTKDAPEVPRYEIPVCDEHYRRIEGGEAYHLDADQWVLLMGTDIKAADLRLITSVVDLTDDMGTAVRHAHEFHVEYEDGSPGVILLSDEALRVLRSIIETWDLGRAPT